MKNSITEILENTRGINSRPKEAEEWISDMEDRVMERNQAEEEREKTIKSENRLRELSVSIRHNMVIL